MNKQFYSLPFDYPFRVDRKTIHNHPSTQKFKEIQYNRSKGMLEFLIKNFKSQYFKEKEKNSTKVSNIYQNGKENYGMFIEAYKVGNKKNEETRQSMFIPRITSFHSRTSNIRIKNKKGKEKKPEIDVLGTTPKLPNKEDVLFHQILPQRFNDEILATISQTTHFFPRLIDKENTSNWGIFFPAYFLVRNYELLKHRLFALFFQGIEIYTKANNESQRESVSDICKFTNILQSSQNTTAENEVFFKLGEDVFLPQNLIMIDMMKDYPVWYPFFPSDCKFIFIRVDILQNKDLFQMDLDGNSVSIGYQKKELGQFTSECDSRLQEKIKYLRQKKRKIKLRSRKKQEPNLKNLQFLLEQMKNEEEGESNERKRKKNQYQVMSQLVKNNKQINKQIQKYNQETRGVSLSPIKTNQKLIISSYFFQ